MYLLSSLQDVACSALWLHMGAPGVLGLVLWLGMSMGEGCLDHILHPVVCPLDFQPPILGLGWQTRWGVYHTAGCHPKAPVGR